MGEGSLVRRKGFAALSASLLRALALAWALVFFPVACEANPIIENASLITMADVDDASDTLDGHDPCGLPPENVRPPRPGKRARLHAESAAYAPEVHARAPRARDPPLASA